MTSRIVLCLACLSCASGDRATPVDEQPPPPTPPAPPAAVAPDPEIPFGACAGPEGRTLRTLVIGNSQIYFQNLPKILTDLSASAPAACPRIAAEPFTRGGQNLHRLWTGGDSEGRDLATTIRDGKYDVVVISECIDIVDFPPPVGMFAQYATLIVEAARAAGSRPILYATPYVRKDLNVGFVEMATPQLELGRTLKVTVAAGGLAWLRVWNEMPEVILHHPDNAHPGQKGSIISSMVIWSTITRASPVGLTAPTVDCDGPCDPLTPQEAELFPRAAWEEVRATGLEP